MSKMLLKILLLANSLLFVVADVNLHNPRGCNNRLDETKKLRKNSKRLFDSENNNGGGHNVGEEPGKMTYYSGTTMMIEWANQHSCGDENNNCEVVLQYMCGDDVRDGTTTDTIPVLPEECEESDCDTDQTYGHHESWRYYAECYGRERNKGLFVANQRLEGDSAIYTRQAKKAARYGYECPEERDYYPYWRSSPWIDIAVMTNDTSKCDEYFTGSQNTKERWECKFPDEFWENLPSSILKHYKSMDKEGCEASSLIGSNGEEYNGIWTKVEAHGVPSPQCLKTQWSRDNHQGNTLGGEFLSYNWELPSFDSAQKCVVRIRYNISTNDYPTNLDSSVHFRDLIWPDFGFSPKKVGIGRGYYLRTDPNVDIFNSNFKLQLAINPSQFGRTFQDRSHVFQIAPVPEEHLGHKIHNINVRGKRGNIVQTYPSVEYDFVPNDLTINVGECVQFQWTGSDSNNRQYNGQGKIKTDRSNVVLLKERNFGIPVDLAFATNYPKTDFDFPPGGLVQSQLLNLACLGDCNTLESGTLDDRSSYFNSGPLCLTTAGTFYYMSTRNNAFSNRDQKGVIHVVE